MIRNVVLDMGNVMLDYNPERYLETYIEREEDRPLSRRSCSARWNGRCAIMAPGTTRG